MSEHFVQRTPTGEDPGTVSFKLIEVEGSSRHHTHGRRVARTVSKQCGCHMSTVPAVHVGVRVVGSKLVIDSSDSIREVTVVIV